MSLEDTGDLWWKNAIIYCVDTQSFFDGNGDGIGDLDGLTRKIDYLAGLGVTCLWLMPIYPSPERDHGYDVADYYSVADKYGTLGDVVELIRTARERGIRVIADLVVNHTSSEHPWFQAARRDRDSVYHDYYVWADKKPDGADEGLIFPGKQKSIWSYDRVARRWYMHRFYPHQPDLNINNPRVRDEIHKVIGFWLELGLSGFRVDAVPFLIEQTGQRNGSGGEAAERAPGELTNPADPHDYLRDLRAFLSRRRGDAMLLAEANEPVGKLKNFFGERGGQMHVLFNFIVNQALYLALARGDARPVTTALESLPDIPPAAQWANFIKNHDEASFDKLSDAERAEVFAAFAPKKSQRLFGRGIRRRFPSMVDNDRRRMELAYSLMLCLPGTPVIFYGEEIGLGDDPRAPGREAVRLPMQWTSERSGGFTSADPSSLPRKTVRDGPLGYLKVNVRAQREDPESFLNWMERAIRTRKEWPEFGWGAWRLLGTRSQSTMAHLMRWKGSAALAVHNFSDRPARLTVQLPAEARFAQRGRRKGRGGKSGRMRKERSGNAEGSTLWRHVFGVRSEDGSGSPTIDPDGRLNIQLPAYGYHWFGRRPGA